MPSVTFQARRVTLRFAAVAFAAASVALAGDCVTLTTVDVEDITINYPSIWELMDDLRDMGESNAINGRRAWIDRDVLMAADAIYKGEFLLQMRSCV